MRHSRSRPRGCLALVEKGSLRISSVTQVAEVRGPFSRAQLLEALEFHRIPREEIETGACDKWPCALVLRDTRRLARPVSYIHRKGHMSYFPLADETRQALTEATLV